MYVHAIFDGMFNGSDRQDEFCMISTIVHFQHFFQSIKTREFWVYSFRKVPAQIGLREVDCHETSGIDISFV